MSVCLIPLQFLKHTFLLPIRGSALATNTHIGRMSGMGQTTYMAIKCGRV